MIHFTLSSVFSYLAHDIAALASWLFVRYEAVLPALKIGSVILSAFFVYGAIWSAIQSRYHHLYADQWFDRLGSKDIVARRMRRAWDEAVANIQDKADRPKWVAALKGAEEIMQEGLRIKGHQATSDGARANKAYDAAELAALDDMKAARAAYAAAKDDDAPFAHETAVETMKKYKRIIRELGIMGEKF